jgi:carbamoyltransferase
MDAKIVAVFNGKSESGRRALGNRSILADPRNPNIKNIINEKVKHRRWYRPFAPSILESEVREWFKVYQESPYMQFVLNFKDEKKHLVPAVVHQDGTARLQTVRPEDNEWYHGFLTKWYQKSGVPIILNTSFNDREPICENVEHSVKCFLGTNIDYLFFPEYSLILRRK